MVGVEIFELRIEFKLRADEDVTRIQVRRDVTELIVGAFLRGADVDSAVARMARAFMETSPG
jgi:hypothetical protein